MICKNKYTVIVIVALTAMLLVPAVIMMAVTVYAEQQQQQPQNEDKRLQETRTADTNTVDSVGNTGTDDTNPEYNATRAEEDPALTSEEIDMRVDDLIHQMDELYFENHALYEAVSDEGLLDGSMLETIEQNNQTIRALRAEFNTLLMIVPDIHISDEDLQRLEDAKTAV